MPSPRRKPSQRDVLRDYLFKRDGGRCRYCGGPAKGIDHVDPLSNGGADDAFTNMVTACRTCNSTKSRELGFTLNEGKLYWEGKLVGQGLLFGKELMEQVRAQRTERQRTQGLLFLVDYKSGGVS